MLLSIIVTTLFTSIAAIYLVLRILLSDIDRSTYSYFAPLNFNLFPPNKHSCFSSEVLPDRKPVTTPPSGSDHVPAPPVSMNRDQSSSKLVNTTVVIIISHILPSIHKFISELEKFVCLLNQKFADSYGQIENIDVARVNLINPHISLYIV